MTAVSRRTLMALAAAAIGTWGASFSAANAAQDALTARSNDAGNVRVVVKPTNVVSGETWTFEVTMDTHVKPLDTDLVKNAVLVVGDARVSPVSWKGDPPGGHHRKGILSFPKPAGPAGSFTLELAGVGGVAKRAFTWTNP